MRAEEYFTASLSSEKGSFGQHAKHASTDDAQKEAAETRVGSSEEARTTVEHERSFWGPHTEDAQRDEIEKGGKSSTLIATWTSEECSA